MTNVLVKLTCIIEDYQCIFSAIPCELALTHGFDLSFSVDGYHEIVDDLGEGVVS